MHSPEERQRTESSRAGVCWGGEGVAIRLGVKIRQEIKSQMVYAIIIIFNPTSIV